MTAFDNYGPLVHASSLWAGMAYEHDEDKILEAWGQGCVELHYALAEIAFADFRLCERLYGARPAGEWPGVYLYQVTEPLGAWMGAHIIKHGDLPLPAVWQTKLRELVLDFFPSGTRGAVEKVLDTEEVA